MANGYKIKSFIGRNSNMEIGPALPPRLRRAAESGSEEGEENVQAGPQLPREQKTREISEIKSSEVLANEQDDMYRYGPALPPGFQKTPRYIGPTRPETMKEKTDVEEEEEETIIGPMPPSTTDDVALHLRTKWDFESRSQAKKEQMTVKKDKQMQRESWMTELPPELSKNFGLGPRTFRARAAEVGDRSAWTDTPSDKARKGSGNKKQSGTKKEPVERTPWEIERDKEMLHQVEEHNKRSRGESLLDMHRKKVKKQQDEEKDKIPERRPFDREIDLGGPKLMDPTKRKATVEKSKQLGSRFQHSSGGSSHYL